MLKSLYLFLLCLVLTSPVFAQSATAPITPFMNCHWGAILSGQLWWGWSFGDDMQLTSDQLTAIEDWNASGNFWDAANYRFVMPADAQGRAPDYTFIFQTATGEHTMMGMISASNRLIYLVPFVQEKPFAQPDGSHFGKHGCAAFVEPTQLILALRNG